MKPQREQGQRVFLRSREEDKCLRTHSEAEGISWDAEDFPDNSSILDWGPCPWVLEFCFGWGCEMLGVLVFSHGTCFNSSRTCTMMAHTLQPRVRKSQIRIIR